MKPKLPPDEVVAILLRFGFRESDIADRFEVEKVYVTLAKKRLGMPMKANGDRSRFNRNMAPKTFKYGDRPVAVMSRPKYACKPMGTIG